jgi:hypothetical protein
MWLGPPAAESTAVVIRRRRSKHIRKMARIDGFAAAAVVTLGVAAIVGGAAGCETGTDGGFGIPFEEPAGACASADRVGAFEIALLEDFTGVQGKVADGVAPYLVPEIAATSGPCLRMVPPNLFCDPACTPGTTCDVDGRCIEAPSNLSVGRVLIDGLAAPVAMTATEPVFFYTNLDPLEHPGCDAGDEIVLKAEGDEAVAEFALGAWGIEALQMPIDPVRLESERPVSVRWTAPREPGISSVQLVLNITQHGGTPGWIQCEVPDTGAFDLPVALTDQLLAAGYSGYPTLGVTRRSVDSTDTSVGCVELLVLSARLIDVEIPGLISCGDDEDCPPGQSCQGDLRCG